MKHMSQKTEELKNQSIQTSDTIFAKIVRHELPAKIVYQDEYVTAFHDINPIAPVHILIVPNKIIPTLNDVTPDDERILGKMLLTAKRIADEFGIAQSGYRLIMNVNKDGGQVVFHLHMHVIGGRMLGRMVSRPE
jgi:histidine triad (HIT) family protein